MHNYILTHKDMEPVEGFEIIDNRKSDLDHRLWSEIAGIKIIYDRIKKQEDDARNGNKVEDIPEWISLNHYRRIFDKDCHNRVYVAQPMVLPCSVAQQYASMHFIEDLQLMGKAIKECYPNMVQASEQVLNGNILIPYNIGIMPVKQFMDWVTFILTILKKVDEYLGQPNFEKMKEIISKRGQPKVDGRNNDIAYQARLYSFGSERLSTIYWLFVSRQIPVYPARVILLEEGQKI